MSFRKLFVGVGVSILVSGCFEGIVSSRAQSDLGCSDVQVTSNGGGEFEASGCGGSVDYACMVDEAHSSVCIREGNIDAPTPTPIQVAAPAPSPQPHHNFPLRAAISSMKLASSFASDCDSIAGPRGTGSASVTFENDGHVSSVVLSAPFEGTPVGQCVADKFRRVTLPSFATGPKVTHKSFEVPEPDAGIAHPSTAFSGGAGSED